MLTLGLTGTSLLAQAPPAVLPVPGQINSTKIKITKLADLPPHTYVVSGKAADFVKNDAAVQALAKQVEADVQHDLATYDIQDPTTLRGLYGILTTTAMLRRDYPAALLTAQQVRDLAQKPQEKLTSGLVLRSLIVTLQSPNGDFDKTLEAHVQTDLTALPYDQVQDSLKSSKGSFEVLSEPLLLGSLSAGIDPVMQTGTISQGVADALLGAAFTERYILPHRAALLAAYTTVLASHQTVVKQDIWPARDVTFSPSSKRADAEAASRSRRHLGQRRRSQPLPLALLDRRQRHAWHRVDAAFGPIDGLLYPLPADDQQYKNYLKGFEDLQANVDSPDAAAVRAKLASLSQDQVKPFLEGLRPVRQLRARNPCHGNCPARQPGGARCRRPPDV